MLKQLQEAEALDAQYQTELKQYSDNDPNLIEAQSKDICFTRMSWQADLLTCEICADEIWLVAEALLTYASFPIFI